MSGKVAHRSGMACAAASAFCAETQGSEFIKIAERWFTAIGDFVPLRGLVRQQHIGAAISG